MTTKKILFFVVFVAAVVAGVHRYRSAAPPPEKEITLDVFICPVHSDLDYNAPGKCKICGEELVRKEVKR